MIPVILVISLVGLVISIWFGLRAKTCKGVCFDLSLLPAGRLFGIPNWQAGVVYYIAIMAGTLLHWPLTWLIGLSGFGFIIALYLFWMLIFKLKVVCYLCVASHIITLILFAYLTVFVVLSG